MSISLCLRISAVLLFFLVAPTLAHSQSAVSYTHLTLPTSDLV